MNDRGFVEQRVMMGAAGLEHIMWQTLVLEGGMSERQYRDQDAHEKLRRLLTDAQIPTDIDAALLPVTARLAAEQQHRQGKVLDGPDVVTQIRNRLVHLRDAQERMYRLDGLVAEVWRLTRHYLALLILHSLGYQGSYRDLRKTGGRRCGRRPVEQDWSGLRGSNPVQCFSAVQGRSGGPPMTCDPHSPTMTARARRGPAVPDAMRTQRGPEATSYRELGKHCSAARCPVVAQGQ
jgi:hypothetical protein